MVYSSQAGDASTSTESYERPELLVIIPSRGRPQSAERLQQGFRLGAFAKAIFVIDEDDGLLPEYLRVVAHPHEVLVAPRGRPGIVDPLNWAVSSILEHRNPHFLGFMGDDHLPKSVLWDVSIAIQLAALKTGLAYGNDLYMGSDLPTAIFMTSDIPRALGFMAPPELKHLFVDNYWLALGEALNRIAYLDEVIIEHLHPLAGKSEWDVTYKECNEPNADSDRKAFSVYEKSGHVVRDANRILDLISSIG